MTVHMENACFTRDTSEFFLLHSLHRTPRYYVEQSIAVQVSTSFVLYSARALYDLLVVSITRFPCILSRVLFLSHFSSSKMHEHLIFQLIGFAVTKHCMKLTIRKEL